MRRDRPTLEEKAVNQCLVNLQCEWFRGDEYRIREALVNLNLAVRAWQPPRDTKQLEMSFGEKE